MRDPLAFFAIERDGAVFSAAIVAHCGGRFRLLAADLIPATIDLELLLEDLVNRVVAVDPGLLIAPELWPTWPRLEVATRSAPRVVCAGPTERDAQVLSEGLANSGWEVVHRAWGRSFDAVGTTRWLLDRRTAAVAVAADSDQSAGRTTLPELCAVLGATAGRRHDLLCLLAGSAVREAHRFPTARVIALPTPEATILGAGSSFGRIAVEAASRVMVETGRTDLAPEIVEGHHALARSTTTLAEILGRRVETVAVGQRLGSRAVAGRQGIGGQVVRLDGALVPPVVLDGDDASAEILTWSSAAGDPLTLRDRLRNLTLAPLRDAGRDTSRVRLAALRAALQRTDRAWARSGSNGEATGTSGPRSIEIGHGRVGMGPDRPSDTRPSDLRGSSAETADSRTTDDTRGGDRLSLARVAVGRADRLAATRGGGLRSAVGWTPRRRGALPFAAPDRAEVVVASGTAFHSLPPGAVAIALIDGIRYTEPVTLLHDHARLLAPLGAVSDDRDRMRLLTDLMHDLLLPLGSSIVVGLPAASRPARLQFTGAGRSVELEVRSGMLEQLDLPPGATGTARFVAPRKAWSRTPGERTYTVAGGLSGLIVDARPRPLKLPDRPDDRRDLLARWEQIAWQETGA